MEKRREEPERHGDDEEQPDEGQHYIGRGPQSRLRYTQGDSTESLSESLESRRLELELCTGTRTSGPPRRVSPWASLFVAVPPSLLLQPCSRRVYHLGSCTCAILANGYASFECAEIRTHTGLALAARPPCHYRTSLLPVSSYLLQESLSSTCNGALHCLCVPPHELLTRLSCS